MNKLLYIGTWFTIIAALVLMILILFWSLYPYNPITFNQLPYKVLNENNTIKHGEMLIYEVDYCKYTDQDPVVTKYYIDGIIYQTPPGRGVVVKGCHIRAVYNEIPSTLPPGNYYMKVLVDYQVNPIRHIIYTNLTEQFTVTK